MRKLLSITPVLLSLIAYGCNNPEPSGSKSSDSDSAQQAEDSTDQQNNIPEDEINAANDIGSEFGQDDEFKADTYVEDLLATDDEFIVDASGLNLIDEEVVTEAPVASTEAVEPATVLDDSVESVTFNLIDAQIDLMIGLIFTAIDSDDKESLGLLTKDEFVDGVIFPKIRALHDETAIQRIKDWRTLVFEKAKGDDEFLDEQEVRTILPHYKERIIKLRKKLGNQKQRLALKWHTIIATYDKDQDGKLDVKELKALRSDRSALHKKRKTGEILLQLNVCLAIHNGKHTSMQERFANFWKKSQEKFKEKHKDFVQENEANLVDNFDGYALEDEAVANDTDEASSNKDDLKNNKKIVNMILKRIPKSCVAIIYKAFAKGVVKETYDYINKDKIGTKPDTAFNCVKEPCKK